MGERVCVRVCLPCACMSQLDMATVLVRSHWTSMAGVCVRVCVRVPSIPKLTIQERQE